MRGAPRELPSVRQQHGCAGVKRLCDVRGDRLAQVIDGRRARDRATERVEGRRASLPPARRVSLVANPRSEMARQDGDDEEGPERKVVLRISHPQRMEWFREEEIVDQDAK